MSKVITGLGLNRRADFHGNAGKMPARITPTQIGAIGEQIVAVQLVLASDGRFSPFLPVADDDGIDLLVFDKATRRAAPIQVKSRTGIMEKQSDTAQFDVRLSTFEAHSDAFLLAIILDLTGCTIRRAWLIPMSELESVARVGSKKLSITPSAKESSKDRYAPYRCSDMAQVAQRLTEFMDRTD